MRAENFEQVLEALMSRQPFRVFTIELTGGKRFEIDSRHAARWAGGAAVFVAPGSVPIYFDSEGVSIAD